MKFINKQDVFLLEEIVKKNFSSKYKDSVLGILWSVLKPLCTMIILTIVFSTLFKGRVENYPVYLLSGRCIYDFFSGGVSFSIMSIKGNKNILLQTSAPKYIFVLGSIFSEFINFIISVILLLVIMVITKNPFYFSIMPLSIIPIISTVIMVTGIGLIVSIVCVYYTDIKHLWGIVSLILMYCSALFYPMDIIPEPYRQIMLLNPEYWLIDQFRDFIAYGIIPNSIYIVNSLLISTMILIIGVIIFKKYENKVSMRL